ncbi:MAG TPA: HAMP domain-containing sensor histidine kinase [Bacteroidales bacterium]|nr:HAMP domain-containing sensor histidine kinase [Bacteroidales bacterium]
MKLIEKTGRTYFRISLLALIISGAIVYFALSYIFRRALNENLLSDIDAVSRTITEKNILPSYFPYIEVKETTGRTNAEDRISDTLIFDRDEQESIPFRQIRRVISANGKTYLITARDTLPENSDLAITIAFVTGVVLILLLLSLYLANRKLSLRIWRPFYRILADLKRFSYNDPGFTFSPAGNLEEFIELKSDLEILTGKIISDYRMLKRFTGDASHELQTPLAIIQSKLETLMQLNDLKSEHYELISSAYTQTIRVSRLAQTLLLLTKISNDQFPDRQIVNISVITEEKIIILSESYSEKQFTIEEDIKPGVNIETNTFLFESLIMNLLTNAFRHSASHATIEIILDENEMIISNSGPAPAFDTEKIFDRFFKGDKSSSTHGLGLSIVKEICSVNNWEVRYIYENGRNNFIVSF